MTDPLEQSLAQGASFASDRFTLPGQIPDASDPSWRLPPAERAADWRARGLAHPAGRGWGPVPGTIPLSSSPRTRGPGADCDDGAETPWVPASAGMTKKGGEWPSGW